MRLEQVVEPRCPGELGREDWRYVCIGCGAGMELQQLESFGSHATQPGSGHGVK